MKAPPRTRPLYGLMVECSGPEALIQAVRRSRADGYTHLDAYAPYAIEDVGVDLGASTGKVALATLLGGVTGGVTGYFMQWYAAVVAYPINVGGRPFHSAPSFIPITFELTILFAAVIGVVTMFALNGLPRLNHPVFNVPAFRRASQDRFFLCIEAADPRFDREATRTFLAGLFGAEVHDVED